MKKSNFKQILHSQNIVRADKLKKMLFLWALVFSVFAVQAAVSFAQGDEEGFHVSLLTGAGAVGGAKFAITMGAIGDIGDVGDKYTQPDQIGYEIALVEDVQIDNTVAFPLPNASREVGDITLLPGEIPHYFKSHSFPTYNSTGEKGDFSFAPTKELLIVLADFSRDNVLNFVEEKAGAKFIIFFRKCGEANYRILGSLCKPMEFMNYEGKLDHDASVAVTKFGNKSINQFYKYTGTLQREAPVEIGADAVSIAFTSNSKYNTSAANAAPTVINAFTGLAAADYGRYVTVYGKGGGANAHTIADLPTLILKDGATWTGNVGSSITFQIVDTTTIVETSRIQTA